MCHAELANPPNPDSDDDFGLSVSLDGDTLAVGAPSEDGCLYGTGAVTIGGVDVPVYNGEAGGIDDGDDNCGQKGAV